MKRDWHAYHIFYHRFDKQDSLLLDCIAPLVAEVQEKNLCKDWFFIRYWEGGPHIRLRFLDPDPLVETMIHERITDFITAYPPKEEITRDQYYRNHKFDGEPVDPDTLPWYPNGSIVKLPYEPEYQRYGGKDAMAISEKIFTYSSEMALKVMGETAGDLAKRLNLAMDLMILTARCLDVRSEELAGYFKRYADYWGGFLDQPKEAVQKIEFTFSKQAERLVKRLAILEKIHDSQEEVPLYRIWVEQLKSAQQSYHQLASEGKLISPISIPNKKGDQTRFAVSAIAFSQIHMTNNRLGLAPPFEHYLGYMIYLIAQHRQSSINAS